jgi:hypothetical protein
VKIERSAYAPAMPDLEAALRKIIAEVVREELQAILGRRGVQMEAELPLVKILANSAGTTAPTPSPRTTTRLVSTPS